MGLGVVTIDLSWPPVQLVRWSTLFRSAPGVQSGTRHLVAFKCQVGVSHSLDAQDSGLRLAPSGELRAGFPGQLYIFLDVPHHHAPRSAVHGDIIPHTLVEVVEEQGLKGMVFL